mmetsp:Transcript_2786/g.3974  ORF Transcript_2786/g.3974 Transcript_2786/m.3974 type:complete len:525 (+) Transcript_2786:200-1774(+)
MKRFLLHCALFFVFFSIQSLVFLVSFSRSSEVVEAVIEVEVETNQVNKVNQTVEDPHENVQDNLKSEINGGNADERNKSDESEENSSDSKYDRDSSQPDDDEEFSLFIEEEILLAKNGVFLLEKKIRILEQIQEEFEGSNNDVQEMMESSLFGELIGITYELMDYGVESSHAEEEGESNIDNADDIEDTFLVNTFGVNGSSLSSKWNTSDFCTIASYPANEPNEDRFDFTVSGNNIFAAVFDGHGSWHASEYAHLNLIPNLQEELSYMNQKADPLDQTNKAISRAFGRVERAIFSKVMAMTAANQKIHTGGSCAILSLITQSSIFVANAGDCRAVLGRQHVKRSSLWGSPKYFYQAIQLSADHNIREPSEQVRLRTLHPQESDVFICKGPDSCYVKGRLQPTRGFGDVYIKYPELNTGFSGPFTPPYSTAEPEIIVHPREANDAFLILGSDGLWEDIRNDEAVDLVAAAIQKGETNLAAVLVNEALDRAAKIYGMTASAIRSLSAGRPRRRVHDDITVIVILLE